jgi:hypothetical protein
MKKQRQYQGRVLKIQTTLKLQPLRKVVAVSINKEKITLMINLEVQ